MNAENIGAILDALALRFGTTAAHLWGVLVRQVYVSAAYSVGWLAAGIVALRWVAKNHKRMLEDDEENIIALAVVGVAGSVAVAVSLSYIFAVFNPEYAALQSLANMLKEAP